MLNHSKPTAAQLMGIWDTTTIKVRMHVVGCGMLKTQNRRRGFVVMTAAEAEEMRERNYKIVNCKCTKVVA